MRTPNLSLWAFLLSKTVPPLRAEWARGDVTSPFFST